MSGESSGEREGRSRRPSPLRATLPLQAMHRTSPLRLRNRISPDTEIFPDLDIHCKGRAGSRGCSGGSGSRGSGSGSGGVLMRRTASLDAIYLKALPVFSTSAPSFSRNLHVDKTSQTPDEWAATPYGGINIGWSACEEHSNSSSNSSSCTSSRRPSASVVTSTWLHTGPQPAPNSGEQIDKFIRQRLQRTNKESGGAGLRYSPVHADHSVLAPTPTHPRTHALQQHANGGSRAIAIPQQSRQMLPTRLRSSVEGLNQEIERLVLQPPQHQPEDSNDGWSDVCRDGRRAPIADYLRFTRSIDTQTPARGSGTSGGSSTHTSPSLSPPMSPSQVLVPSSPSPSSHIPPLATSPHINKFLEREPPDGCEKISIKPSEDRSKSSKSGEWPTMKPPAVFTLRPSQGSAFCPPERIGLAEYGSPKSLRLCQPVVSPENQPGTENDSSPDDEKGAVSDHIPRACQSIGDDKEETTRIASPASHTFHRSSQLTADQ